jgi:hypothetical protein
MNDTIDNQTTVAVVSANNSETQVAAAPKAKVGRPRVKLTREVTFVQNADGSIVRRGKGKPAHDSKAMVYSVAWDYKGTQLPESAMFLRMAEIKDTRKPKQAATENPVVPATSEILPTV